MAIQNKQSTCLDLPEYPKLLKLKEYGSMKVSSLSHTTKKLITGGLSLIALSVGAFSSSVYSDVKVEELYEKHCASCHGKEGYGDGSKADEQEGDLGDFSTAEFQAQSDGALFYKTSIGRDDMPEYTKKMPDDEDRWLIVNYMRTLEE